MTIKNNFEVDVLVAFSDYWRATVGYLLLNVRVKLVLAVGILSALTFVVLRIRFRYGDPPYQLLIPAGAVLIGAIVLYLNTRSVFAGRKFLQNKVKYVLSDEGICSIADGAPGMTSWRDVPKAFELKNDFVVFYLPERMYVFPRQCFKRPIDLAEFKLILARFLNNKVQLK